jgi:putative endonuclease
MKRIDVGKLGEKLAADLLKKRGYKIIETNYRCPRGEIDIIARHNKSLVFIEVRSKTSLEFGTPEESITAVKRERIRTAARHYLQTHEGLPEQWQIDVVAIELTPEGKTRRIELIENAVGEN